VLFRRIFDADWKEFQETASFLQGNFSFKLQNRKLGIARISTDNTQLIREVNRRFQSSIEEDLDQPLIQVFK